MMNFSQKNIIPTTSKKQYCNSLNSVEKDVNQAVKNLGIKPFFITKPLTVSECSDAQLISDGTIIKNSNIQKFTRYSEDDMKNMIKALKEHAGSKYYW